MIPCFEAGLVGAAIWQFEGGSESSSSPEGFRYLKIEKKKKCLKIVLTVSRLAKVNKFWATKLLLLWPCVEVYMKEMFLF